MSTQSFIIRARAAGTAVACAAIMLTATACAHVPQQRHKTANPDQHLMNALRDLDVARADGRNTDARIKNERVIVDAGRARARVEQLSVEFPRHTPTLLMNADLAYDAGEYEDAGVYADRVLELQPANAFAGIIRARVALHDGNIGLARKLVNDQLAHFPDSPQLYEVLSGIEFLGGDYQSSEAALASAEALGATPWRIAFHRGLIADARGSNDEAAEHYRVCLELNPTFAPARARLAAAETFSMGQ